MADGAICPLDWRNQTANHNRLAIIVYDISCSALSSPMNILSTFSGFRLMKLTELDSLVV